ncbi:GTP cyclohydrolase II [Haliscomenobacter hydrossis]|uniref:GTP cyclohydrolase-2 n=1 Tax=Haliscomenobacter hydrossis (strain ATCC 27775 / DSM 1100 / LMG 10767 / O) TaxID=760192 RepID=F4KXY2_HALH1|nr:GTP cyclohydrolase II [Haliscomenobacter hydrossis]AEE52641.1 GTP cyclohydrolase-2 [Haliscomenobacter hydrossis DSM 1100]
MAKVEEELLFMKIKENRLVRQAEALIPTPWGNFRMGAYAEDSEDWMPHLALVSENCDLNAPVLTRLHSECITGDLFGSKRCDCGEQLAYALHKAAEEGGIVLYLRQEGRGIGIINKLKAYNLQDIGLNTIDANLHLGFEADARDYGIAIEMLEDLGVHEIKLLTNNPDKIEAFEDSKVKVIKRIPIIIEPNADNREYLRTKQDFMGHML